MAPQPKTDYESTLKRVKANIRDKRAVQNRDLDILMNGDKGVLADIIEQIEDVLSASVDLKYHRHVRKSTNAIDKMPATPKHPISDNSGAESSKRRTTEIIWTGKQDTRFKLQTIELETIEDASDNSKIAIGVARSDPEPRRVMVASFDSYGKLNINAINVSSDGKQFQIPEGMYEKIEITIPINIQPSKLMELVEFRTEIDTDNLVYSIRQYVWDQLIERGLRMQTMGWNGPNEDFQRFPERGREMRQLAADVKITDPCGFMSYRKTDTGRELMLTAIRFGKFRESKELEELKTYLSNPTEDPATAILMYNNARMIIDSTF